MGIAHACFGECDSVSIIIAISLRLKALGLGAFLVPLVSTKFANSPHWSFHYLTSIGVACVCIVCSSLAFRFRKQDGAFVVLVVCGCTLLTAI